ncbi:MAG: hypothetical protein ACHQX0_01855 [Desulfobaccales bacterium]
MNLNDRVEMLSANAAGWSQGHALRTNLSGWVVSRYLESFPVSYPRSVPKKRAPSPKTAPEEETPSPAPAKPKAM